MKRSPGLKQEQEKELEKFIRDKNHTSKEVVKAQVVLMVDKRMDLNIIKELTGYSRRQSYDIRRNYLLKGLLAIEDKDRKNPKELLTKKQREEITEIVKNKVPRDYNYSADYWTTGIVSDLIWRHYKVKYRSKTSIYIIFKRAKFTYHKPDRLYQARNEQEVERWETEAKLRVNQALQEKDTIILTADEMSLSMQTTVQKVWLPQGEYPKIEVATKRDARSIYGFSQSRS